MVSRTGIGIAGALFLISAAIGAATQLAQSAGLERPLFQVDPAWPKIPNGWALGQVSSAAADANDHIWLLHRSRVVRAGQKTGPPVMEFDAAGNYVQGWGGAGRRLRMASHRARHLRRLQGLRVDRRERQRRPDPQVHEGRQVRDADRQGRREEDQRRHAEICGSRPTSSSIAKTNELFVADGYGNRRIIVFDADTGAFKRMWGAFGNAPMDDPSAAGRAGPHGRRGEPQSRAGQGSRADDPGPPQFDTVHGVKVSNDGLVYAADRGGKRVQVFTIAGKFVTQAWVDRWCEAVGEGCGNGQTAASMAFSADPEQRFLYVASRSPAASGSSTARRCSRSTRSAGPASPRASSSCCTT